MVDTTTLSALQIFHEDRHPSNMGIGKPKEGLSIYGIMNRCVTNMVRAYTCVCTGDGEAGAVRLGLRCVTPDSVELHQQVSPLSFNVCYCILSLQAPKARAACMHSSFNPPAHNLGRRH